MESQNKAPCDRLPRLVGVYLPPPPALAARSSSAPLILPPSLPLFVSFLHALTSAQCTVVNVIIIVIVIIFIIIVVAILLTHQPTLHIF